METEKRCLGCMRKKENDGPCPLCGYDEAKDEIMGNFLRPGTILNERYLLGRVIGQGGFGITYIGYDNMLDVRIAVKEFFPGNMVQRVTGEQTVMPYYQTETDFTHGRKKFMEEARILAKFSDEPGIVGIKDCFEANGTAYMVMQYLDGITLKRYLENKGGTVPAEDAVNILMPVMDVLRQIHTEGVIHRDISPDNIMITANGQVDLIDFGAARQLTGGEKSISILLKRGFAPEEQYRRNGTQGAWTDVYGISATLYYMLTGAPPPEATERILNDTLVIPEYLPQYIKTALSRGLAIRAENRIRSVEEFVAVLCGKSTMQPEPPQINPVPFYPPQKNNSGAVSAVIVGTAAVILIMVIFAITVFVGNPLGGGGGGGVNPTATPALPQTQEPQPAMDVSEVPAAAPTPTPVPTVPPHRYEAVEAHVTWNEAESAARAAGGHLATIGDAAEFKEVQNALAKKPGLRNVWVGARLSGTFESTEQIRAAWTSPSAHWITGEPLSFTKWRSGEPSGYDAKLAEYEFYLQIFSPKSDGYAWSYNDAGNDLSMYKPGTLGYVIEYDN